MLHTLFICWVSYPLMALMRAVCPVVHHPCWSHLPDLSTSVSSLQRYRRHLSHATCNSCDFAATILFPVQVKTGSVSETRDRVKVPYLDVESGVSFLMFDVYVFPALPTTMSFQLLKLYRME